MTDGKGLVMQCLQQQGLQHKKWRRGRADDTLRVRAGGEKGVGEGRDMNV